MYGRMTPHVYAHIYPYISVTPNLSFWSFWSFGSFWGLDSTTARANGCSRST